MKRLKRLLSMLLGITILAALFSGLQITAVNAETTGEYYSELGIYFDSSTGTITDVDSNISGDFVIPAKIDGVDVKIIGEDAFSNCTVLESVEISEGVETIRADAFYDCRALTSVTFPATLVTLSTRTFSNCYSLSEIYFNGDLPSNIYGDFFEQGNNTVAYCKPQYFENYKNLLQYTINQAESGFSSDLKPVKICTGGTPATLNDSYIELTPSANSYNLRASIGTKTSGFTVQWYSSNPDTASVNDNGKVTSGKAHGSAIVYAIVSDGNNSALVSCQVSSMRNDALVKMLPDNLKADFPVQCNTTGEDSTGKTSIVMATKFEETDTSNETYQEILSVTNDLTKNCSTNYEKAKAIQKWVSSYLSYGGMIAIGDQVDQIYSVYKVKKCRCQGYADLTGLMLYMAGIPNGIVTSYSSAHTWNIAYLDDRWVMIDSTWKDFDFDYNDSEHGYINYIGFGEDDLCFVVYNSEGVKLCAAGRHEFYRDDIVAITVPSYVKKIMSYAFAYCDNLKTVTIPSSVEDIDSDAFYDCDSLSDIYYAGTKDDWNNMTIASEDKARKSKDKALKNAVIHCNSTSASDTQEISVESVSLSNSSISVKKGSTASITALINPSDAADQNVFWYSDDESIATVTGNGLECTVNGVAAGTATITAETSDGGYTASAAVTVTSGSGRGSSGGGSSSFTAAMTTTTVGASAVTVDINGTSIGFDVAPTIINDRTMVPLRAIFETLGASVDWDESTRTITAVRGSDTIKLTIDSDIMTVNGSEKTLDTVPTVLNSRTLVPVRAISEALGCTVTWDGTEQNVHIEDNSGLVNLDAAQRYASDYSKYVGSYFIPQENREWFGDMLTVSEVTSDCIVFDYQNPRSGHATVFTAETAYLSGGSTATCSGTIAYGDKPQETWSITYNITLLSDSIQLQIYNSDGLWKDLTFDLTTASEAYNQWYQRYGS